MRRTVISSQVKLIFVNTSLKKAKNMFFKDLKLFLNLYFLDNLKKKNLKNDSKNIYTIFLAINNAF